MRFTGSTVPSALETCATPTRRVRGDSSRSNSSNSSSPRRLIGATLSVRAGLLAHHLPGHDVGVVLERGDQDLVAGLEARPRVGLRDQVDRLGSAAHEDDLARRARIDEAPHALARALEGGRRRLAQRVHAAMHVGVRVRLVVLDRARSPRSGRCEEAALSRYTSGWPWTCVASIGKSARTRSTSKRGARCRLAGGRPSQQLLQRAVPELPGESSLDLVAQLAAPRCARPHRRGTPTSAAAARCRARARATSR